MTVSDGTAHGGDVGAKLLGYNSMTIWSDPNYGYGNYDALYEPFSTLTQSPYAGTINFKDNNVQLTIGDRGILSTPPTLSVFPLFYFIFDPISSGQGVTVNGNFNYYGLNASHDINFQQTGIASPFINGGTIDLETWAYAPNVPPGQPVDPIVEPSVLEVHPGANFYTGSTINLVANSSKIIEDYGNCIYPIGVPIIESGQVTLLGKTTLNATTYLTNIPSGTSEITTVIDHGYTPSDPYNLDDWQFKETNCTFINSPNSGVEQINIGRFRQPSDPTFSSIRFEGGTSDAIRILVLDPGQNSPITIEDMKFSHLGAMDDNLTWPSCSIGVWNDNNPTSSAYPPILIQNNEFIPYYTAAINSYSAIWFYGFDGPDDPGNNSYGNIAIYNNKFDPYSTGGGTSSAIALGNTSAFAIGNNIDGTGYDFGIDVKESPMGHLSQTVIP